MVNNISSSQNQRSTIDGDFVFYVPFEHYLSHIGMMEGW